MNTKIKITEKDINPFLLNIFNRIGIDTPSNYRDILDFITNDISETSNLLNWHSGDVEISFSRWIEKNYKN